MTRIASVRFVMVSPSVFQVMVFVMVSLDDHDLVLKPGDVDWNETFG